uniref:RNase H type-1 domain-containing protein n=1 Tax=Cannabis sativa TaxID=3483 RepID=A0A803NV45_CANSA
MSPLVTELYAIRDGIKVGMQWGLPRFDVQSDCLQALKLINGEERGCREVDGIMVEIQRVSSPCARHVIECDLLFSL